MLTNNITRFLDQRKIHYTLHDLQTNEKLSAEEVAAVLSRPAEMIFKTIILGANKNTKPIAALVPANSKVDQKKLAAALNEKKVAPLTLVEAEEKTGMQAGGISPLGLVNKPFRIILDDSIKLHSTVIISAGARGWQIELKPEDLISLCKAKIKPITSHE